MDLKEILSHRILDKIIGTVEIPKGEYLVLVLDKGATKIISSACKMQDVLARGVTLVESLEKQRAPMKFEAIYVMEPSMDSIHKFLPDWDGTGQVKEPLYKAAHVFFTESCPDLLLKHLANPLIVRHIKTLKEADICFLATESRMFSLTYPTAFHDFYKSDKTAKDPLFTKVNRKQINYYHTAIKVTNLYEVWQGMPNFRDGTDPFPEIRHLDSSRP